MDRSLCVGGAVHDEDGVLSDWRAGRECDGRAAIRDARRRIGTHPDGQSRGILRLLGFFRQARRSDWPTDLRLVGGLARLAGGDSGERGIFPRGDARVVVCQHGHGPKKSELKETLGSARRTQSTFRDVMSPYMVWRRFRVSFF